MELCDGGSVDSPASIRGFVPGLESSMAIAGLAVCGKL
jgi:hypothetical protein